MSSLFADVELAGPLPTLSLGPRHDGVAVLARLRERPVGFVLEAMPAGTELGAGALAAMLASELREALVRESVADALGRADAAAPPEVSVVSGPPNDSALRDATTAWVAFRSPAAVADRGWSAGLAEALAEQPDAAAVTGLVLPRAVEASGQAAFERAGGFHLGFEKLRFAGPRRADEPFYPVEPRRLGAVGNLVVRREAALAAGGAGAGGGDLLYRLLRAGHALAYEPRMLVFYSGPLGWEDGPRLVAPTARADPRDRGRARRAVVWWTARSAKRVVTGPAGSDPRPRGVALAELGAALAAVRERA